MKNDAVFAMKFAKVYPLLVAKAGRKGRTRAEVDAVTAWLTGYTPAELEQFLASELTYGEFLSARPTPTKTAADHRQCLRRAGRGDCRPAAAGGPLPGQARGRTGQRQAA